MKPQHLLPVIALAALAAQLPSEENIDARLRAAQALRHGALGPGLLPESTHGDEFLEDRRARQSALDAP